MKKKNIVGIINIALFVIGIAAALMQYKREQKALEQPEVWEEPETVVLSADDYPYYVFLFHSSFPSKVYNCYILILSPIFNELRLFCYCILFIPHFC